MTLSRFAFVFLLVITIVVVLPPAQGVGFLSFPAATYVDEDDHGISALIHSSLHPTFYAMRHLEADREATTNPMMRVDRFLKRLVFADIQSLRELADMAMPGCGNSRIDDDVPPVGVMNATHLEWSSGVKGIAFPAGDGPCEVWIDDMRVQYMAHCLTRFSQFPARIPVDYTVCESGRTCVLRFYWFSVEANPFKLIKHCVRITNSHAPLDDEQSDDIHEDMSHHQHIVDQHVNSSKHLRGSTILFNITISVSMASYDQYDEGQCPEPSRYEFTTTIMQA